MKVDDPERYEQDVLALVRSMLIGPNPSKAILGTVHDVRLEGSRPDTELVVEYERFGHRKTMSWGLWNFEFEMPGGGREPPSEVATLVLAHVSEQ